MYNQNRGASGARPSGPRTSSYGSRPRPSSGGYNDRSSFSSRSSGGNSRFAPRSRNGGGRGGGERIDIARFINKRPIQSEVEIFTPKHTYIAGDNSGQLSFALDPRVQANVAAKGYVLPTPIQDAAIPAVLEGRDVVGLANTGTGKTAAFLLPLITKVLNHPEESILIVAPTRELAIQIDEELKDFVKGLNIHSVCVVGGAPIYRQISQLRFRPHFIIGTPGRIKDLMQQKYIRLNGFKTVVLDEADRMLDMGFVGDMRFMMAEMPKERQTLFFSATLSPEIERLISEFLTNPVHISVRTRDTSASVEQDIVRVDRGGKFDALSDLLKQADFSKVLVFGKTKHGVERLSEMLAARGFKAASIHGDKNHSHRQRALGEFKRENVQILVATDVAARGLDIPDVTHVINYDMPMTYADYTHRIGRTGRAGKIGKALTFIE